VTLSTTPELRQPDIADRAAVQKQLGQNACCATPAPPAAAGPLDYGAILNEKPSQLGVGEAGPADPKALEALQKSQQAVVDAGVALFSMFAGENLEDVARRFDSSVEELKTLNPQLAQQLDNTVGKALRDQMVAVPVGASDVRGAPPDASQIVESGPTAYQMQAPDLASIRQAQGATMHRGMGGPQVMELQRMLNAQGANPPLAVDGKFGPKTEAMLKAFQGSNGVQQTGVLGPQTLGALDTNPRRITPEAASAAGVAPAPSPGAAGAVAAPTGQQLSGSAFGNQVAAAAERSARQLNSVGRCALGVNNALVSLGVQGRGHAYQKAEQLANNPRFREVNVSSGDLSRLPAGAVVVWGRSGAKPYGHVSVALGDGREASDHIGRQITGGRYGTDFGRGPDPQGRQFRVFLPA
jgi:peptidoglycan hydrolase-like protein with peptidoglycan-binding domain